MSTQFDFVTVSGNGVRACHRFAERILEKEAVSPRDFGSSQVRDYTDSIADMVEGKVAELAFAQMIRANTGIMPEVNFNVYDDQLVTDMGTDLPLVKQNQKRLALRTSIDVKSTRAWSHWMLVDHYRFHSDVFVIAKVSFPEDIEINDAHWPALFRTGVKCKIVGFAYRHDFLDPQTSTPRFPFKRGEQLFNPNTGNLIGPKLKSRLNFGFPMKDLRQSPEEWFELFRWIKSSVFYGRAIA